MRNSHSGTRRPVADDASQPDPLSVGDVLRHLSGLAKLYSDGRTGNVEMGDGVGHVVSALRPYANSPVSELKSAIAVGRKRARAPTASPRKPQAELPNDLKSLPRAEIEKILQDDAYTKRQVAELGHRRFGLSRSALTRSRREDALTSIRAAMEHELSLEVIGDEAEKAGKARMS